MASISSIGSSGLQAAQLRLDSAAHNVANMNTAGFKRQTVAQEAVEQMAATYAYKANLQTIKTQDEMMGALLDVRA